uniref:D53A n=1 Tax=Petunia hybrida TaxID=4102 RepID=A0A219YY60_PETHY|nr:D53A [Petunia x hybrida]
MPTPVSTARQCLTEEAARALDDAVSVARRRSHAQTTSLHAVSALLALPSSTLRDACARARSCAYSPRLQFRALELSVSVSLDRLPTAKTLDSEPPISNSLMAAIKRSQANQRRHPDTFHIYQQLQQHNSSNFSISTLKVELKHFILSILDDPIVSRVFGEAGFRSCDLKLSILNPPTISRTRCPPLFLCNLTDSELNKRGFNFPFSGVSNIDENSRRIGEILVKKSCRNPLLVGVCASRALCSFTDCVQKGKGGDVLPEEIKGLTVICVEKEIEEFVAGGGSEERMSFKFKEVSDAVECCGSEGVMVNYGEVKVFVDDGSVESSVKYVVSKLSQLVQVYCGKLWLVGAAASYDIYIKFLARFPTIHKDWDLHLLPITSSTPPIGELPSKSSLIGSFVPFGGFFSTASEFEKSRSNEHESTARCNLCNEKYEQEVSAALRGATASVADQRVTHLSSWLHKAECGPSKGLIGVEANENNSLLNARVVGLQKKWNDICQRLHQIHPFQPDTLHARSHLPSFGIFQSSAAGGGSSIKDSFIDAKFTNQGSLLSDLQNTSVAKKAMSKSVISEGDSDSQAELAAQSPETQQLKMENICTPSPHAPGDLSLPLDRASSASIFVSTDLGLGTIYLPSETELWKPSFQEHQDRLKYFSGSVSSDRTTLKTSNFAMLSSSSVPQLEKELDAKDFKNLYKALSEHVYWQEEAIYAISKTVSRCRSGNGRRRGSSKGNIWLSFLGPDKVGKQKIAIALAEKVFGSRDSLLCVDLSFNDGISCSNSLLNDQGIRDGHVNLRRKTVVDYIAEELSKKRCSVVLLENIEKADFLVQNSLSHSIRTGKFSNMHGKEISINNMIFVITSKSAKATKNFCIGSLEFSEETILAAKNMQMQISIGSGNLNRVTVKNTNLWITSVDRTSEQFTAYKRKQIDNSASNNDKLFQMPKRVCTVPKSSLDLNLPLDEVEEENQRYDCDSDSGSEGSKAWLEEILEQMDNNVVFKPFDFGVLAEKILKEINLNLQETVGIDIKLEIDAEVMAQILAAAWLSDRKEAVEDWVEKVLSRSFMEVRSRSQHIADSIIRLVNCQGIAVEDHASGIHLPARITVD